MLLNRKQTEKRSIFAILNTQKIFEKIGWKYKNGKKTFTHVIWAVIVSFWLNIFTFLI